jgi:hypothetical protein
VAVEQVNASTTPRKSQRGKAAPTKPERDKVTVAAPKPRTAGKKSVALKPTTAGSKPRKATAPKPSSIGKKPQSGKVLDASHVVTKVRRARVPSDFAAQYGETERKKRAPKETATARKARRNAEERERLRAIMIPDDNLLQRLARIGAIAPSDNGTNGSGNGSNGHTPRRSGSQAVRRPRKWESRCGKCGVAATFKAAAGVCSRCGAIAVRQ